MVGEVDLSNTRSVTPASAPVTEANPLTGKERAGIWLTWGIIGVLVFLLLVILLIFFWGETRFLSGLDHLLVLQKTSPEAMKEIGTLITTLDTQQTAFRTFWFDTLQLILLNVLFPTLTALLGYVFGTSRNRASGVDDG